MAPPFTQLSIPFKVWHGRIALHNSFSTVWNTDIIPSCTTFGKVPIIAVKRPLYCYKTKKRERFFTLLVSPSTRDKVTL